MNRPNQRGMSIVEIAVAAGLVGMLTIAVTSTVNYLLKGQAVLTKKNDLEGIRASLTQNIDCARTFATAGGNFPAAAVSVATDCSGAVGSRKSILLRDRNGNPLSQPLQTGTGDFQGAGRLYNDYFVHAYCDAGNPSLVVRVAKASGTSFAQDPTTKTPFDFTKAPNPIFGTTATGAAGPALCGAQISGSAAATVVNCAAGFYLRGLDFATSPPTPNCAALPAAAATVTASCGADFMQSLNLATGVPVCAPAGGGGGSITGGSCPGGLVTAISSTGVPTCVTGQSIRSLTVSPATTGFPRDTATCGPSDFPGINGCRYTGTTNCPAGTKVIGLVQASCGGFGGEMLGAVIDPVTNSAGLACREFYPSAGPLPPAVHPNGAVSALCATLAP